MEIDEQSAPHGQKRQPEDDLENEQRLAKRFNLLNLENGRGNLYIPKATERPPSSPNSPIQRKRSNAVSDSMNVDDTRNRIYIHDLDAEIADIESDEQKVIFIPDIEKKLNKIPKSVLLGEQPAYVPNEVVLYKVPESLSVPQEQDGVRKAIMDTRRRMRENQGQSQEDEDRPRSSRMPNGPHSQQQTLDFPPTYAQIAPTGPQTQSTVDDSQEDFMEMG